MDSKAKDTLVLNFYGGPGTGKSIMMSNVFSLLKWQGIPAEIAPEYAKEQLWQESNPDILNNQLYIFAQQHNRVNRLLNKVDVIVTDAPLLNSILYNPNPGNGLDDIVAEEYNKLNNVDILLKRTQPYEPDGRLQSAEEAEQLDKKIVDILDRMAPGKYRTYKTSPKAAQQVTNMVITEYNLHDN